MLLSVFVKVVQSNFLTPLVPPPIAIAMASYGCILTVWGCLRVWRTDCKRITALLAARASRRNTGTMRTGMVKLAAAICIHAGCRDIPFGASVSLISFTIPP